MTKVELIVTSSNIRRFVYDSDADTLVAEFKGPTKPEWEYKPVSPEIFAIVLSPGSEFQYSIGKAFNALVKSQVAGRQLSFVTNDPKAMSAAALESGALEERIYLQDQNTVPVN